HRAVAPQPWIPPTRGSAPRYPAAAARPPGALPALGSPHLILRQHAQHVLAEDLADVCGGEAARPPPARDEGALRHALEPVGAAGDGVEVAPEASVIDPGHACDMLDVIDHFRRGDLGHAGHEGPYLLRDRTLRRGRVRRIRLDQRTEVGLFARRLPGGAP